MNTLTVENNLLRTAFRVQAVMSFFFTEHKISFVKKYVRYGESRFCFSNSLRYAKENDADLMWGVLVTEQGGSNISNLHSFCYDGASIIDTTYKGTGIYGYELISKNIWDSWPVDDLHPFNDYVLTRVDDIVERYILKWKT